jgi:hypothetical protein
MKNKLLHLLNTLLFVTFSVLLLVVIKPELIYHLQQLGFTTSTRFLNEFLAYPGGVAEYLSLFLFQFSIKPIGGAIVGLFLLLAVFLLTKAILHNSPFKMDALLNLIPVVFMGILFTDYTLHPVFFVFILLLYAFFVLFKLSADSQLPVVFQLIIFALLFPLAYYTMGGFAYLVLTGTAILHLLLSKRKDLLAGVLLLVLLAYILPLLAQKIFFITNKDAYFKLVPYFSKLKPSLMIYLSIFSLPFIILVQKGGQFFVKAKSERGKSSPSSEGFKAAQVLFMIAVLLVGIFIHVNKDLKHKLKVDYLAHYRKWDELLKLVESQPSNDRLVNFQTTRALYHKGVLTEKLFDYPQTWGVDGLFLTRYFDNDILLPSTELLFDLAYINEAVHIGNEALSQNEYSPFMIEQLVLASLADNKYPSAMVYTKALKQIPVYRKKAETYERFINGENNQELTTLIKEKQALKPVNDFMVDMKSPDSDLLNILNDRPKNKMAYEYLMAYYLLNNDLGSFVSYFGMGQQLGYKKIPKVFQEALILYIFNMQQQGKQVSHVPIDNEITSRFRDYLSVVGKNNGNLEQARPELEKQFGNTYWFYINFTSPITNNKKVVVE